jgi:predicted HAD superfamily Cof-like phosphohydrolase
MSTDWIADVLAFHRKAGTRLPEAPTMPTLIGARDRIAGIVAEEAHELCDALLEDCDLAKAAKEGIDVIYATISSLLELGLPIQELWDAVAISNATKVGDGVTRHPNGKIAKGPNYVAPDVAMVLARAEGK